MIYNPKNRDAIYVKCGAMSAESLENYVQTRTTTSATDSIDDPVVKQKILDDVNLYMISVAFSAIDDAKIFFNSAPEKAYDEFVALLNTPAIKDKVIAHLQSHKKCGLDLESLDEQEREKIIQLSRYESVRRKVDGLAAESAKAKKALFYMKADINEKYPGLIPDEDEE